MEFWNISLTGNGYANKQFPPPSYKLEKKRGKRVNLSCVAKLSSEVKSQNSGARHMTNIAHRNTIHEGGSRNFQLGSKPASKSDVFSFFFFFFFFFLFLNLFCRGDPFIEFPSFPWKKQLNCFPWGPNIYLYGNL